jgi:hypothetical protein
VAGKLLRIYLNDQLGLAVVWREVAKRAARENEGTELGRALSRLAAGNVDDVDQLEQVMARAGVEPKRSRKAGGVVAERLGRLKLNGRIVSYSPLSRFSELDTLCWGLQAKKRLWTNLRDLAGIEGVDYDALITRAEVELELLEEHRQAAGREALNA